MEASLGAIRWVESTTLAGTKLCEYDARTIQLGLLLRL